MGFKFIYQEPLLIWANIYPERRWYFDIHYFRGLVGINIVTPFLERVIVFGWSY